MPVLSHVMCCCRRVKENEEKKREAKEKGIKVSCKRMVSNDEIRNSVMMYH